jgi:hypothetical protein
MRRIVLSLALVALVGAPEAFAQGGSSSMQKNSGTIQAPVGHRQPRPGDVPNEKNLTNPNDPINKEDAALDKKLKSICRGC